jgi:hypothetical protein
MESNENTYYPEYSEIVDKTESSQKINSEQEYFTLTFKAKEIEYIFNILNTKEEKYQEAISNLIKKSKFLQLYIQLAEDQITEEEFESELIHNPNKFVIKLKELSSNIELEALLGILQSLPIKLSIDEVSEIFGINTQSLYSKLNT